MAFPDDQLTEDEDVVLHLHPHWRVAIWPVLVLLVAVAAFVMVWVMLPSNDGGHIGVGVVGVICLVVAVSRGVRPLVGWRCDHYVFTTERILLQDGVISRLRRDLPLNRINDHVAGQSLLDRVFGCGTLRISSIGDDTVELTAVPHLQQVQTTLYELIESDRELRPEDEDDEVEPELPQQRRGFLRRR